MAKPLIILDSGHARNTGGKRAPDNSLYEWEFNNDMQNRLEKRLKALGFDVYKTNPNPDTVSDIGLTKRAQLANSYWASKGKPRALFISLHANAYGVWTAANGVEVFHAKNASTTSKNNAKILCKHIHEGLKKVRPGSVNRGVKSENFTVIYKTTMPSVLIEYAFYTNREDLKVLKNNRAELCEATIKGICECFGVAYRAGVITNPTVKPVAPDPYLVKIIYEGAEGLNIRKEPNAMSQIMGQVRKGQVFTIVETKNGWGKLKSGMGWINLSSKYVKKM